MNLDQEQQHLYWKLQNKQATWQRIPASNAALKHAISIGAYYSTVAQFTIDSDGNPDLYFAPFYIDFDGENISEAINDAIAFINYFESEFGYPIGAMRIFLTGGRGVHIEIPAVTFGADDGDPNLIYIYKAIIEKLPFKTLDLAIYNQKKGRMWRLPNLQRTNGRYKVPVTVQELMSIPLDELWALTEKPRHDFQFNRPEDYPVCESLKFHFEMKRHEYYEKTEGQEYEFVIDAELQKFFIDELPECIKALLNTTDLSNSDGTNFNQIALTLARFYSNADFSVSNLLEDAEEFCITNFTDSAHYPDLNTKLEHLQSLYRYTANNSIGSTFSCGFTRRLLKDGLVQFKCDRCPIHRPIHSTHRVQKSKSTEPFVLEDGLALIEREFTRTKPLVEEIIGANKKILLAAADNVGKSLLAHQAAIALAVGLDKFLFFDIPKPRSVLYLNLEMSEEQFHERHQLLCSVLSADEKAHLGNFHYNTVEGDRSLFQDSWARIRASVNDNPAFDLIIVDNIFACSGADDESNRELKGLLKEIFSIAKIHGSTILLITHDKKHPPDSMISKNLIRGGSTIANAMDVIIQLGMSLKAPGLRLMKITKNRDRSPYLQKAFGLKLDPDTLWFTSTGPVQEAAHLNYPPPLKGKDLLEKMDDIFKTADWVEGVEESYGASRRTAYNWLERLTDAGLIKLRTYGFHEKIPQQEQQSGE